MKRVVVMLVVAAVSRTASAEHWYEGSAGRDRKIHLAITLTAGAFYLASETFLDDALSPDHCRWCNPPSFDVRVRDALRWDDVATARTASDVIGHVAIPVLSVGAANALLIGDDASWADVIDVTLPVLETAFVTQAVTGLMKGAFGRERPLVHFSATPIAPAPENNLSFWSGHTSLSFAFATSAGMVAHLRGSRAEPIVWGVGMTLATSTGYLRIAGDKHYLADVVMGAAVGLGAGLAIPRLLAHDVAITTSGRTVAVVGTF